MADAIEKCLDQSDEFSKLLKLTADEASVNVSMLFLPTLSAICGLMAKSTIETHKPLINFKEPNILWSVVAAPPGSRKTVAMNIILEALNAVKELQPSAECSSQSLSTSQIQDSCPRLFSCNETITTAKLHDQIMVNDGIYLNIIDEVEGLFESLEARRPDSLDRRVWLSLFNGSPWTRNSKCGLKEVCTTRLNYTGFIQPALLKRRLEKGDVDGFMDRHMVYFTRRRAVLFEDIGEVVPSDRNLSSLFKKIYQRHHMEGGEI